MDFLLINNLVVMWKVGASVTSRSFHYWQQAPRQRCSHGMTGKERGLGVGGGVRMQVTKPNVQKVLFKMLDHQALV